MTKMQDLWEESLDGQLSEQQSRELEQHLSQNPSEAEKFEQFKVEHQQTSSAISLWAGDEAPFVPEQQLEQLRPRLPIPPEPNTASWFGFLSFSALGALAVLAIFLTRPLLFPDSPTTSHPTWVAKGTMLRMLHQRKGQKKSDWTRNGTRLKAGDFVQFAYHTTQPIFVMIVSIDGKGNVSRYIPLQQTQSVQLQPGKGSLPQKQQSVELDDSLGLERIFLLTSQNKFQFRDVEKAMLSEFQKQKKKLQSLTEIPGIWKVQQTLLIQKVKHTRK